MKNAKNPILVKSAELSRASSGSIGTEVDEDGNAESCCCNQSCYVMVEEYDLDSLSGLFIIQLLSLWPSRQSSANGTAQGELVAFSLARTI